MDSFELNKFAGGLIAACLLAMVIGKVSSMLVHPVPPAKPVFEAVDEAAAPAGGPAAAPAALEPIAPLLASANTGNGEAAFNKRCATCHTANQGGANKVGPNLFSVVGGKKAHLDGFSYSKALTEKEGPWDYEALNAFIAKPAAYIRGTKMAFAGVGNMQERADIIAWLRTQHSSPPPLPQ
ncbi:MAG: cytochrome c family protein [Reyranellaceae bacterium]